MSDELTPANDLPELTELQVLKERAKSLGVTHSNNISVEALRAKITAHQAGDTTTSQDDDDAPVETQPELVAPVVPGVNTSFEAPKPQDLAKSTSPIKQAPAPMNARQKLIADAMKLVRLRITNLDPKKKDWPGEFITVANDYIGTVRKYVPFGEKTQNGYHVPYCIYEFLRDKQYLHLRTATNKNHREQIDVDERDLREYALEILPPLTEKELDELRQAQNSTGRLDAKD